MGGLIGAIGDRLRELRVALWENRTKVAGYLGVLSASIQMAVAQGQHWQMLVLGALVAAIGHYNDRHRGDA